MSNNKLYIFTAQEVLHELATDYFYEEDTGKFIRTSGLRGKGKKGTEAGWIDEKGYRLIEIEGKSYRCHRLAYLWMTGDWPKHQVDHINNIKDDNRWCNLRDATNSQNQRNTALRKNNTSGVKGVNWHKGNKKWRARVGYNNKRIHIGDFKLLSDAEVAIKKARKNIHKEYCNHGQ